MCRDLGGLVEAVLSYACPSSESGAAAVLTKITAAQVREMLAAPPAKDTSLFDVLLPRFALRVKPSRRPGGRPAAWYFVRYTAPDGRERRIKVGNPGTMLVEEARKAARAVLAVVDAGGDPKATQERVRAAPGPPSCRFRLLCLESVAT